MARIFADATGAIIRVLAGARDEAEFGPPASFTSSLELDPETNPAVLPAIAADHNGHRLVAGVLSRNGVAYTISPPGEDEAVRLQVAASTQLLRDYLALATPTGAQTAAALKVLIRLALWLLRWRLRVSP